MLQDGAGLTVNVIEQELVHPFEAVTVTVYIPASVREEVIAVLFV
jgi:hypothetical protein